MKMTLWAGVLVGFSFLTLGHAQDEREEMVELSAFSISSESDGYVSGSLSRTRVSNTDNSTVPTVPVTVVKRADAVAVQFVLRNDNEKPELRNKELYDTITALETAAKAKGLVIEQREVRFSGDGRKLLSFSKSSTVSFVNLAVIAPLEKDLRVADVVKSVRDLFTEKRLMGRTKMADGVVGLVLRNPGQYRNEILNLIFADTETIKKGVGSDFEVQLSGLNRPILMRPSGEGSLELWIDYSFSISSIRVLTQAKR